MITQKEIQDAVLLIIENLEECTDDTLERLSFAIWVEQHNREFEFMYQEDEHE
mgnify:CR=1 FL=1